MGGKKNREPCLIDREEKGLGLGSGHCFRAGKKKTNWVPSNGVARDSGLKS